MTLLVAAPSSERNEVVLNTMYITQSPTIANLCWFFFGKLLYLTKLLFKQKVDIKQHTIKYL